MIKYSKTLLNYYKTRTWAIFPPIDIDLKNPHDERNPYQENFLPSNIINMQNTKPEVDIRDASGLKPYQKLKFLNNKDIPPPRYEFHLRRNYARYLYATYGNQSNIDPSICWPTKEEITDIMNDEKKYEKPLSQSISELENEKNNSKQTIQNKLNTINKNMAVMDKLIKEFENKVKEKDKAQSSTAKSKMFEHMEEAREYFGYRISIHDPRYKNLIEERELMRKKQIKLQKQKVKSDKQIATVL